jgi:hypothetical protein
VEDGDFRKSSRSSSGGQYCVAVAQKPEGVAVRDTKDPKNKTLFFSHEEWNAFTAGVKAGEFGD